MNDKQLYFRVLREYVFEIIKAKKITTSQLFKIPELADLKDKYVEGMKITSVKQLDSIVSFALKKSGHKYHLETVRNNSAEDTFYPEYSFTWDQVKVIANLFVNIVTDKANVKILEFMLEDFLRINDTNHSYNARKEARKILGSVLEIEDDPNSELVAKKGKPILRDVITEIDTAIGKKSFVFLQGEPNSGKKIMCDFVINEWFFFKNFKHKIRIDCEKDPITFSDFLKRLWSAFNHDAEYTKSTAELMRKVQECITDDVKIIVFINGFDCIKKPEDQKNIISFLEKNIPRDNIVILTSTKEKDHFGYISNMFTAIKVRKFTIDDWMEMASAYKANHEIARKAEIKFKKIAELAFLLGDGNPKQMQKIYIDFCNQMEYDDFIDFNPETNMVLFKEVIKDLDDNCISCLVTLSLFANPIASSLLAEIAGLEKLQLSNAVDILKNKLLIKVEETNAENENILYSLPNKLRAAIEDEKRTNSKKYKRIFDRWIQHFRDFENINDISVENDTNQENLKLILMNIGRMLDFCEETERWEDYCVLSQILW